ncbi:MAG: PLP-dependent cysteine synthase family protein, partial [Shewanella sp.]
MIPFDVTTMISNTIQPPVDSHSAHRLCPTWEAHAIGKIEADFQRSADTHLIK